MAFKSWRSFYFFIQSLKKSRYIFDEETNQFLEEVLNSSASREATLHKDTILWRAQLGCDEDQKGVPHPYSLERMKPLPKLVNEGRANPTGIAYLYLATHRETAMSEVRPWIGKQLSLAEFLIEKELRVVDCTKKSNSSPLFFSATTGDFFEPSDEEKEKSVWHHIGQAFSTPVNIDEDKLGYIPTQIICELLRKNGIDGLIYTSNFSSGHNIVLFDTKNAKPISCNLFITKGIKFEFEPEIY